MIQRIQSLWLLLAAACAFAGLKFSFYSGTKPTDPLLKELNGTETILLMITGIAVGGLALITIFFFKTGPCSSGFVCWVFCCNWY
ncbi:MAG: DUF4293 family protein [Chitinophagaceae bacterium]|nr:DUF4293 family protein [Chitinophagaceae bacterium]